MFGCDPQNVDKLKQAVFTALARIAKEGIGDAYLAKVREQIRREHETNLQDNQWWIQAIHEAYWSGESFTSITDANAEITRTPRANVQAAAKRIFDPTHYVLGVMKPRS